MMTSFLIPVSALAQVESGTIAGVVRDTSGAVLPGVTVEASSPQLIEKVRSVITDGEGLYQIVSLRPGTYTVTFTLTGFNTFRREGIQLTAAFTATVNAELRVGAIEETVTVTGASPMVDTQGVLQQQNVSRDVMDALPAAKTFASYAVLTPGVTVSAPDVGGAYGDLSVSLAVHGSRGNESQIDMDGMSARNGMGSGGGQYGQFLNNGMMQEIVVETGSMSAESETAGVRANIIPREGGNRFVGVVSGAYTNANLNSQNVSDELVAQGLNTNAAERIYDFNPSAGGPVLADKLWYFLSLRVWGSKTSRAGPSGASYHNKDTAALFFEPDLSRQAFDHTTHFSASNRLTWQVTPRNKVNLFYEAQNHDYFFPQNSLGNAPETRQLYQEKLQYLAQASWSAPVTSRLLLEGGWTLAANDWPTYPTEDVIPGISPITELSTNFSYRASPTGAYGRHRSNNYNWKASVSYVTGSHAFKTGLRFMHTWSYETREPNSPVSLAFRNGTPNRVTQFATPISYRERNPYNIGVYAQDRWIVDRMTFNLGVRADFYNSYVEAQDLPPGPFVPARSFARVDNVPNWKDISPRLGMSYDVFGNGQTAVKLNVGKYMGGVGLLTFARLANPMQAAINNSNRTWHDDNGDYVPNCDFRNLAANGECERISDQNFGNTVPVTRYADDVREGSGVRPYNWELFTSIQHEIVTGVSATAAYVRRWYGNFYVTQNLAVSNAVFTPYCVRVPVDARLPGGGGNELCGFYDVNRDAFGISDNVIQHSSGFGQQEEAYDGFDFTAMARLPRRMVMSGGVSLGRTRTNTCALVADLSLDLGSSASRTTPFCDIRPPMQPNAKFLAVVPLQWGFQVSGTVQSVPGPEILAQRSYSSAEIEPSLGRPLSAGPNSSVLLDLVPQGTMYGGRYNQTDFRITKIFQRGGVRIQGHFDLYNLFNASPPLRMQNRYGPSWQFPTLTMIGRLGKFGLQINF
jgi:hypothetical protein